MRVGVTGATGFIGSRVVSALANTGHTPVRLTRRDRDAGARERRPFDLDDPSGFESAAAGLDAVVHCAAMPDVGACERDPDGAMRRNAEASGRLAEACAAAGARLVSVSTDLVFDGASAPHTESDHPSPINAYGRSKAEGERLVDEASEGHVVARLALCVGHSPHGGRTPNEQIARAIERGDRPTLFEDEFRTPIWADDAASALVELATRPEPPRVAHLAGPDRLSRYELGAEVARWLGLDPGRLLRVSRRSIGGWEIRPADVSLDAKGTNAWLSRAPRRLAEAFTPRADGVDGIGG